MKRLLTTSLIAAGLTATAIAQTGTGGTGTGAGTAESTTSDARHTERDDDGFNLGWLGFIGLAGLLPRKQKVVHQDRVTTDRPAPNRA